MNRGPFIFLGLLIILVFSWTTVVFKPNQTVGQLAAILDEDQGGRLPRELQGAAQHGKEGVPGAWMHRLPYSAS